MALPGATTCDEMLYLDRHRRSGIEFGLSSELERPPSPHRQRDVRLAASKANTLRRDVRTPAAGTLQPDFVNSYVSSGSQGTSDSLPSAPHSGWMTTYSHVDPKLLPALCQVIQ